jgi:hypothetical protein
VASAGRGWRWCRCVSTDRQASSAGDTDRRVRPRGW